MSGKLRGMPLIFSEKDLIRDLVLFQILFQCVPDSLTETASGTGIYKKSVYDLKCSVQISLQTSLHISFKIRMSFFQTPFKNVTDHDHTDIGCKSFQISGYL